jgi:hypothetical protein
LVFLSILDPRQVKNHKLHLLRAFLPSWKFFEDIGSIPLLFFRVAPKDRDLSSWLPCWVKPKRKLRALFLNPEGNFTLACESLLQQLMSDLQEMDEKNLQKIEETPIYELIQNLVRFQIANQFSNTSHLQYQFKVCVRHLDSLTKETEDVLISPLYEI